MVSSPNHTFILGKLGWYFVHILSLVTDNNPFWISGRQEIISRSISTKVWDLARIELATPGSASRSVSAVRHVTNCSMRPGTYDIFFLVCLKVMLKKSIHRHMSCWNCIFSTINFENTIFKNALSLVSIIAADLSFFTIVHFINTLSEELTCLNNELLKMHVIFLIFCYNNWKNCIKNVKK